MLARLYLSNKWAWWYKPEIPAIWEAKIGRLQPEVSKIAGVHKTLI
jgi:hypothetical protein